MSTFMAMNAITHVMGKTVALSLQITVSLLVYQYFFIKFTALLVPTAESMCIVLE